MNKLIPVERIENKIYLIRGQKVMIDRDLAGLYAVSTKRINEQVKRNIGRFPEDFMFQLKEVEKEQLVANCDQFKRLKHSTSLPYAFTEQGVAMLSTVLNSQRAIEINILIMRAFVKLRKVLASNKDLTYLFKELKHKVDQHDTEIGLIIKAIEKMIEVETKPKGKIGFTNE